MCFFPAPYISFFNIPVPDHTLCGSGQELQPFFMQKGSVGDCFLVLDFFIHILVLKYLKRAIFRPQPQFAMVVMFIIKRDEKIVLCFSST